MKRLFALILCLMLCLSGCAAGENAYVPTGDGLSYDEEYTGPQTTTQPQADNTEFSLAYYRELPISPYLSEDFTNRALLSLLYQSLFSVDRDYVVEPQLCKNFTMTEDMKQYTFYLEKNAKFSDGKPVSIYDVYASYMAAMESPMYKGRFARVSEITVTQDGGLTVRLNTAFEDLQILMDIPIVKAAEVAADAPLGSGP